MVSADLRKYRLAFVDDLHLPFFHSDDVIHFRRALRMKPGDVLNVSDGDGCWRRVRLGTAESELHIDGEVQQSCDRRPQTTVAFAPTKGDRPEWTVQKLSELGVGRIVAIQTQRSVVRWGKSRAEKQVVKWRKVAREASMQSRRLFLPLVEPQIPIESFIQKEPSAILCEPGGRQFDVAIDSTVLIGPEGGFTESELALAEHVDLSIGTILKTETAALVAATRLSLRS